jgi:hypothetical protein
MLHILADLSMICTFVEVMCRIEVKSCLPNLGKQNFGP